jgi:hypothetical protein
VALKHWIGTTNTSPTTAGNWSGGSLPTAGDDIIIEIGTSTGNAPVGDATALGLLNSVYVVSGGTHSHTVGTSSSPFKFYCNGSVHLRMLDPEIRNHYIHIAPNTTAVVGSTLYPDQLKVRLDLKSTLQLYGPAGSSTSDEVYLVVEGDNAKFNWDNKSSSEVTGTVGKILINNGSGANIELGPWGSGALTPALVEMGSQGYNSVRSRLATITKVRLLGYESSSGASSVANKFEFDNPDTPKSPTITTFTTLMSSTTTAQSSQVVINTLEMSAGMGRTPADSNARAYVNCGVRFDDVHLSGSPLLSFTGGALASTIRNANIKPRQMVNADSLYHPLIDASDITAGQLEILNYGESASTATFTFSDKPDEGSTITIVDSDGTSLVFEIDNEANGAAGSNIAVDGISGAGGGATGTAVDLAAKINAQSSLDIAATVPSTGKVVLTQSTSGVKGNTQITVNDVAHWDTSCSVDPPEFFTGGEATGGAQFDSTGSTVNIVPMVPAYSSIRLGWTDSNR